MKPFFRIFIGLLLVNLLVGCIRPADENAFRAPENGSISVPTQTEWVAPTHNPALPISSPTPDAIRQLPALRTDTVTYIVQPGDTLAAIAEKYTLPLNTIIEINQIENPDLLDVGMELILPPPDPASQGPAFKIIPDSELIRSPSAVGFDINSFVRSTGGYLASYKEKVDDVEMTGAQIIDSVSKEFSMHPHILLAWLEYQGNWISSTTPTEIQQKYPAGYVNQYYEGLYLQMAWAANNLNMGYYLWKVNAVSAWILPDDSIIPPDPTINAGTAAVQHLASLLYDQEKWREVVSENGFIRTFTNYFGQAFDYSIDPLLPSDLTQPVLQLPFENDAVWSFTGGPHGGWGTGSAWAALDFAPPGDALGCVVNDAWVTAVSDGWITRSENGVVVIDLDGDGYEETGWTVLYLHIETRDRIPVNTQVKAGERIGHPSCEGGVSNGTHVHIARKFNGEWIPADQNLPFIMDGWVSQGTGIEYNGYLVKNENIVEAWDSRKPENQIQR
jgi:LysM repeat protein